MNNKKNGFTLVELAIVLTIVGIIIGGITQGEKLISSYKLTSTISYIEKYKIAFDEFKKQYMALPGDLDDASTAISGVTNNGNDNGRIVETTEEYYAWEHLSKAQLIPGTFDGSTTISIGKNVPAGPHTNSYFRMFYTSSYNQLMYTKGADVLSPQDTLAIDRKLDDAAPGTGRLTATGATPANCYSSSTTYNVTGSRDTCVLYYRLD